MAGIKYTFIRRDEPQRRRFTRGGARSRTIWGEWLPGANLYPYFGKKRGGSRNRPYRFQVWTEYDWLLAARLLTLDYMPEESDSDDRRTPA